MENEEKYYYEKMTTEEFEKKVDEVLKDVKPKEREFTIIAYNESFLREFHEAMKEVTKEYIIGIDPYTDEDNES